MSVGPHGRSLPVAMMVPSNGGPAGSIAMMPLTSFGRASAMSQPKAPDCEWVSTIAGLAFVGAFARPLGVLLASRPSAVGLYRGELKLFVLGGEHARRAVARVVSRAGAHRLVDHVDDVALLDEIFRPALAAVGRAHPVGGGLRRAVDEHQRIRAALSLRHQDFHVNLTLHDLLAGVADVMAPDIEKTALGDGRLVDCRNRNLDLGKRRRADEARQKRDTVDAQSLVRGRHDVLPRDA